MEHLLVYQSPVEKFRLGSNGDGGYVVCDLGKDIYYDCLLSGGISNDITFENNFLNKYSDVKECLAFDGTIESLPTNAHFNITFHKQNLGDGTKNTTNLHDHISKFENVFMKLDIEGHEFDLLHKMFLNNDIKRVKQLVIEWHSTGDIALHPTYFKGLEHVTHSYMFDIMKKLNYTHKLVHFHANNGPVMHTYQGILLPNVFECTYIRDDGEYTYEHNYDPIPSILDRPNAISHPDVRLSGFPYNTNNDICWYKFYK